MDSVKDNGIKMDSLLKNSYNQFLSTIHTQDSRGLYRIGLIGHPGSGKSLVLKWLHQLGFSTIQCDLITLELYSDPQVQRQVQEQCGLEIDDPKSLDSNQFKEAVKNYIGVSASRLEKVSHIMRPKIMTKIEGEFKKLLSIRQKCVIVEVPLLYEANWENVFHLIIYVKRDREQITAQLAQRGWSMEYSKLLWNQYKSADYYLEHADITLINCHTKLGLWTQVKTIIKELK